MRLRVHILSWLLLAAMPLAGCSSLPKHEVEVSELGTRTAALAKMGQKHYQAGQYTKAQIFFQETMLHQASVDDQPGVARSLCSLGRCHLALGDLELAENEFSHALQALGSLTEPALEARALGGLGAVELHRGNIQSAKEWFEKALALPLTDPGKEKSVLLHDLASAQQKLEDFGAAERSFQEALAMHESLLDSQGIAADCYSLAQLNDRMGNREAAIQKARRALANDKKAENPRGVALDLSLLASLSARNGNNQQAADYYRRARLAWKSLGRMDQVERVSERLRELG